MIARRILLALAVLLAACAAPSNEPRAPLNATPSSAPVTETSSKESVSAPPPAPPPTAGAVIPGTGSTTPSPDSTSTATGGEAKPSTMPTPPTAPTPYPTPTPTPIDDVPHAQAKFEESAKIFADAGTDCSKMCKALASMERAAGHLCDLVKDGVAADKKKCTDARARLDHARDRVTSACGGCD